MTESLEKAQASSARDASSYQELTERIERLTSLIAARSDERSQQLRTYLERVGNTLSKSGPTGKGIRDNQPQEPSVSEDEVVVLLNSDIDVLEAISQGREVGVGAAGETAKVRFRSPAVVMSPADLSSDLKAPATDNAASTLSDTAPSSDPSADLDEAPLDVAEAQDEVASSSADLGEAPLDVAEAQDEVASSSADLGEAPLDVAEAQDEVASSSADLGEAPLDVAEAQDEVASSSADLSAAPLDVAEAQDEVASSSADLSAAPLDSDASLSSDLLKSAEDTVPSSAEPFSAQPAPSDLPADADSISSSEPSVDLAVAQPASSDLSSSPSMDHGEAPLAASSPSMDHSEAPLAASSPSMDHSEAPLAASSPSMDHSEAPLDASSPSTDLSTSPSDVDTDSISSSEPSVDLAVAQPASSDLNSSPSMDHGEASLDVDDASANDVPPSTDLSASPSDAGEVLPSADLPDVSPESTLLKSAVEEDVIIAASESGPIEKVNGGVFTDGELSALGESLEAEAAPPMREAELLGEPTSREEGLSEDESSTEEPPDDDDETIVSFGPIPDSDGPSFSSDDFDDVEIPTEEPVLDASSTDEIGLKDDEGFSSEQVLSSPTTASEPSSDVLGAEEACSNESKGSLDEPPAELHERIASRDLADIDEAASQNLPPPEESPWKSESPGEPGPLGPNAEEVVRALQSSQDVSSPSGDVESISLGTSDVVDVESSVHLGADPLEAAREEARDVLSSLGGSEQGLSSDNLEPLERLARHKSGAHRPQPDAVSSVPRRLAYRAMAAPLRVEPDGALCCLAPEDYDASRLQSLAEALERRVVVVEADRSEVVAALEAAYGPAGGVDQDALLMAISEEAPSYSRPSLMGRVSRWLRSR